MPARQLINFKLISILCLAQGSFFSNVGLAQTDSQAFETLSLGLSYQSNTNRNLFHEYWTPNPALQIEIETPFYAGDFFIDGRYTSFTHRTMQVPYFRNIQISTGWGVKYEILNGVNIGGSTGILFSMAFYEELTEAQFEWARDNFGSTSPENETGFIFKADLSYKVNQNWGFQIEWSRNIVYTSTKMKLNYVGLGMYTTIRSSEWLQQLLK